MAAKKRAKKVAKPTKKATAGKSKSCKCKADKFLKKKFINPDPPAPPPHVPPWPIKPPTQYWMDDAYAAYWELYAAVVRLEMMVIPGAVSGPDPAPFDRISHPAAGKAGCPPPPPFP